MSAKPTERSTPYEVFLHLMMMSMMIVSVVSLITLLVQYIDLIFPDKLIWYGSIYDVIRNASSSLLVAYPVFLFSSWLISKDLKETPAKRGMMIRRWLIYLALFAASITVVVDLIQFVNSFYSGELTLPFFLKVLSVLIIAVITFAYFKWDLDREHGKSPWAKIHAISSSVFLLVVLGLGFVFAGSPGHQRQIRLDEERVQDLQSIEYQIGEYWRQKEALPEALTDLQRDLYYFELPVDPDTEAAYEYNVLGELSFELCAHFDRASQPALNLRNEVTTWKHEAGDVCFERSIDPDFYESNS